MTDSIDAIAIRMNVQRLTNYGLPLHNAGSFSTSRVIVSPGSGDSRERMIHTHSCQASHTSWPDPSTPDSLQTDQLPRMAPTDQTATNAHYACRPRQFEVGSSKNEVDDVTSLGGLAK